jgi:hypothetical protein
MQLEVHKPCLQSISEWEDLKAQKIMSATKIWQQIFCGPHVININTENQQPQNRFLWNIRHHTKMQWNSSRTTNMTQVASTK